MYSLPSWQATVVNEYFASVSGTANDPYPGYALNGRSYPDVSITAAAYKVAVNQNLTAVYGTSASCPVFSGMVSLVNSNRAKVGKGPLGWINPSLYAYYESFTFDITSGINNCVAGATVCCSQGFYATPGWDPVTGLGSVNFTAFSEVFVGLGDNLNIPTASPTVLPGSPTNSPVQTPTELPTKVPTAVPTFSSGWLYSTYYDEGECTGTKYNVQGIVTDTCMTQYDSSDNSIVLGSIEYICSECKLAMIVLLEL